LDVVSRRKQQRDASGADSPQARPGKYLIVPQSIDGPASTASAPANASTNGLPPGRELMPSDESLVRSVMSNHGISREKAIDLMIAFGGI
jgi:hypothetical protein